MSLEVTSLDFEGMNGTDRRRIELGYGELQSIYLQYDEKSCSRFAIMFYAMAGCGNWSFFATLSVEMPTTLLGILGAVVKSRSQRYQMLCEVAISGSKRNSKQKRCCVVTTNLEMDKSSLISEF